ncbi:MAG: hypothetical protein U0R52_00095 [Solirubrobacterales bacterium]
MSIRAKLYAAIVLTILGPLATSAVALHGMSEMGDRFDQVRERAADEAIAREVKFAVTDVNGWQTAYGYDNGASRPIFLRSVAGLRRDLRDADRRLSDPGEAAILRRLEGQFREFMRLDSVAWKALAAGRTAAVRRIFLGPEIRQFEAMAATAERLARLEAARAAASEEAFAGARDTARKRLIAVALGAAIVIVLLLVTANDVARMALEGERLKGQRADGDEPS